MSCPSDDQLSDYLSGALDAAGKAQIGVHLDGCDDCRQLVVAAVRAASAPVDAEEEAAMALGSSPHHPAVMLGAGGADAMSMVGALAEVAAGRRVGAAAGGDEAAGAEGAAARSKVRATGTVATPAVGVGSRLGRYVLTELLGVGGMGQVYRARDQELDRDVAVKVLRPGLSGSAEMLTARLLRESRLMARLSHPSVVAVYDVGRQGPLVFVAMELIDGTTLSSWLRGPRSVAEVLSAFLSAARGLMAAHQAGLVHRDFKPDNVLVSLDEHGRLARVVVTDLGVARAATPSAASLSPSSSPGSASPGGRASTPTPPVGFTPPPLTSPPAGEPALPPSAPPPPTPSPPTPGPRLTPPVLGAVTPSGPRRSESSRGQPLHDLHDGLTMPGATIGTPAYMAPEQLEGRSVDQRADVFAFAASLWEALWTSRPFPGRTLAEIAAAMGKPPVRGAARGRVPKRICRALDDALAIDSERRAASLSPLLEALERATVAVDPARRRRRVLGLVAGGAAVIALAAAAASVTFTRRTAAADPCRRDLEEVTAAFTPAQLQALRLALGNDAAAGRTVNALGDIAERWKATQRRLCTSDASSLRRPCLSARRTELMAVREDLLVDPAMRGAAERYIHYIGEPESCEHPRPGALFSRVPDPELRPQVRQLRARLDAAEQLRERGDIEPALAEMRRLNSAAERLWPPLYAETLYAEGSTETQSGDSIRGVVTLKQAAAVAEKARHDSIVAASWTQLVASAAFTDNDVERALEYATYADAALDRVGRPPADEALLLYYEGAALVQAERSKEGEAKLRAALRIAEEHVPERIPVVVQGLGFLYDHDGEHKKAVEMYRQALATTKAPAGETAIYRAQLGRNLAMLGLREEALLETTAGRDAATGYLDPKNDDWTSIDASYLLALRQLGRFEDGLAALPPAKARATAISGERGAVTAVFRQLEAVFLGDLGRLDEALAIIVPTCEAIAFTTDDSSIDYAGCLADQAAIELRAGKVAEAFRHASKSIDIVEGAFRATADVAIVYQVRGEAARRRGDLGRAAADFDKAVTICASSSADPAFLSAAHIWRARLTAATDPVATADQLRQSIAVLGPAPGLWAAELRDAEKLLEKLARQAP
jgi:eukaryotic-like serine/threonine-protein kinase